MNSERQEGAQNDPFSSLPQRNFPPPVPPRSQPATGSLFSASVPSPAGFIPSFSSVNSVPGIPASRFHPGYGPQTHTRFPPDPLLGGYSPQARSLPPPSAIPPPQTHVASDAGKRPGVPNPRQTYSALSGAYHQPPPQQVASMAQRPQQTTPMSSKDAEKVAQLRVQHMESLVSRLQKEKRAMDEEFGRQRKKFMNQMMQTESELNLAKQSVTNHAEQVESLNKLLLEKGEEVTLLKKKLEEAEAPTASVIPEAKGSLGITSTKKRSHSPRSPFDRRSPSPNAPPPASLNFSSENSLETHMVKAAEDAKLLRSVVVPLEEEIDMLKMKLNQAEERLSIYEGKCQYSQSSPVATVETPEMSHAALLQKLIAQEQVARTDLEIHVNGLERQKASLQKNMDLITAELKQVKEELRMECLAHKSLRETWDEANIHFLSASNQSNHKIKERKQQHESEMVDSKTPTPVSESKEVGGAVSLSLLKKRRERSLSWHGSIGLVGQDDDRDDKVATWKAVVTQLQKSVMRLKLEVENKVNLCDNYEKQMQRVQEQLLREMDDKDFTIERLKSDITKLEAAILTDRRCRADAQRSLVAEMEGAKAKIDAYQAQESKMRKKVKTMSEKFMETRHEVQKEVTRFSSERVHLQEQLDQVRDEYRCLKDMHMAESSEYRARISAEVQARNESEMNLKAAMEEISTLQLDREVAETSLTRQLSEMQQQLSYTRQERQQLESELGLTKTELAGLLRDKSNLEAVKNEALDSQASIEEKSRVFIEQQQQKIEELVQQKETVEQTVESMRKQVSALKQQLCTSEANQRDFVELSQSLQVKLVEMEEAQHRQRLVDEEHQREKLADGLSNCSSPSPPETASLLPL